MVRGMTKSPPGASVRMQIVLPETLRKQVDDYRYRNRHPSFSEAMRVLLTRGLAADPAPAKRGRTKALP